MSHYSITVLGENVNEQLAFYNESLPVQHYKERLSAYELHRLMVFYEIGPDEILDNLEDWCGRPAGVDANGYFYWEDRNNRSRFNWQIIGGKFCGFLKLKPDCAGKLGNPGQTILLESPNELRYGLQSADVARYKDIDWDGMREFQRAVAVKIWDQYFMAEDKEFARFVLGIEEHWDEEDFLRVRSHPATAAVVKDSDWYERGEIGWQGVLLDATPVERWHEQYDELLSDVSPDTTLTIVDAHL